MTRLQSEPRLRGIAGICWGRVRFLSFFVLNFSPALAWQDDLCIERPPDDIQVVQAAEEHLRKVLDADKSMNEWARFHGMAAGYWGRIDHTRWSDCGPYIAFWVDINLPPTEIHSSRNHRFFVGPDSILEPGPETFTALMREMQVGRIPGLIKAERFASILRYYGQQSIDLADFSGRIVPFKRYVPPLYNFSEAGADYRFWASSSIRGPVCWMNYRITPDNRVESSASKCWRPRLWQRWLYGLFHIG